MSKDRKPLPQPPGKPFGRRREQKEPGEPLLADKMALARSEGNLEEFLKKEMPDSEHAKKLAMMMAGMTGMMPPDIVTSPEHRTEQGSEEKVPAPPPEDVINAVRSGNVKDLMSLLQREHAVRTGGAVEEDNTEKKPSPADLMSGEEKEVLDACISIASENNLSLDWVVLRALRLYVNEYRKTGRL